MPRLPRLRRRGPRRAVPVREPAHHLLPDLRPAVPPRTDRRPHHDAGRRPPGAAVTAPTRRTLTGVQMATILRAIQAVDVPAALLATVLAHVYDTLLQQDGRRLADLKGGGRIHPEDW